jgi:hypothetical protein
MTLGARKRRNLTMNLKSVFAQHRDRKSFKTIRTDLELTAGHWRQPPNRSDWARGEVDRTQRRMKAALRLYEEMKEETARI